MTDAVGYTRLSQESDRSIKSQKTDIRDYCDGRDLELCEIFDDGQNTSGWKTDRPQFQEMLAYIGENDVGNVVVRDLSRLSRDRKQRIRLLLDLDEQGVTVHSVQDDQPIDLDEDWTLLQQAVTATTDDVGKRKEIDRAKAEIEKRQEQGFYHGRPPYGLRFDAAKQHLERDADEFPVVERVLELRDGGASYPEIAEEVDEVGRTSAWRIVQRRDVYEKYMDI